ncbi:MULTISPECIES: molybdenum cofactor guanylyltransferase [Halorussus]|uniref:molybdenum cofactor guanylyltransferase n=1 Tax=Halorussus sp. JP-T4 TaxID=2716718 RepID=UPI0013B4224B|nr:molybdenum cofactor guanylyltransferase [Halorussus rarus]NHN61589.1 molybdenum cofactor guanylyltransferase [Halorussus sp. JP-T4]
MLAGGDSRRFGEADKAVAVVNGTSFVQRVAEAVHAIADDPPIVAVNRTEQRDAIEAGLESGIEPRFAFDAASLDGPVAGLYGALPDVDDEWLFLTACDMPRLSPAAIAWLATRIRSVDPPPDALVPADADGRCQPLHGFYRREAVVDVRHRLPSAAGLRALLDAVSETITVPIEAAPSDVPLATSVRNINTRREYQELRCEVESPALRRVD